MDQSELCIKKEENDEKQFSKSYVDEEPKRQDINQNARNSTNSNPMQLNLKLLQQMTKKTGMNLFMQKRKTNHLIDIEYEARVYNIEGEKEKDNFDEEL